MAPSQYQEWKQCTFRALPHRRAFTAKRNGEPVEVRVFGQNSADPVWTIATPGLNSATAKGRIANQRPRHLLGSRFVSSVRIVTYSVVPPRVALRFAMPCRAGLPRIVGYVLAVALLCLPTLWNGFPLMFDDVGGYLERWPTGTLGLGRSTVYGLLLWTTRWALFLPVVLLQALVTTFVVDCALRAFGASRSPWTLPGAMAAIITTSGAAFFTSKLMPDSWAAPGVLALHLMAWRIDSLSKFETTAMAVIVAIAGASHMATLGVLAGLSFLDVIAWLLRRKLLIAPRGLWVAMAATWSGLALLLVTDALVAKRFVPTPGGSVFLLGRLLEDGMLGKILAEECPRRDWQLCNFRNELPTYAEAFIWDANSPLWKLGDADDPRMRREVASIIARSVLDHPFEHLGRAATLTVEQFFDTGVGGSMEPIESSHARWTLMRYASWALPRHDAARQQVETIDLTWWSDWVATPVAVTASVLLPMLAVFRWRQHCRQEALLATMLFLVLVGNAAICGVISSPNDRYQARLVWLAPLAIGLTTQSTRRRSETTGSCPLPIGN